MNLHQTHENCKEEPKGRLVRLVTASNVNTVKRTSLRLCDKCGAVVKIVQVDLG